MHFLGHQKDYDRANKLSKEAKAQVENIYGKLSNGNYRIVCGQVKQKHRKSLDGSEIAGATSSGQISIRKSGKKNETFLYLKDNNVDVSIFNIFVRSICKMRFDLVRWVCKSFCVKN